MAYNHRYEVYKWRHWKNQEEKILLDSGMPEEMIQELHDFDWQILKKERTYYRWNVSEEEILWSMPCLHEPPLENIQQLLDQMENQKLYHALSALDEVTLKIIFYRVQKYSYREIERLTGINQNTVSAKMSRLRKKLKNFLK